MEVRNFNTFYNLGKYKNQNWDSMSLRKSLIPPPDPLIERQIIPLNKPKFGKNIQTINLEQFDYKENISENFILTKREKIQVTEKEYIFDIYINSFKMLQKLVYYKEKFDNNKVTIENILNLREFENQKKKKKSKKNNNETLSTQELIKKNNFNLEDTLIFESKFESGNLQMVYLTERKDEENSTTDIDKYQLFLHNDTNTTGYSQWFFFRVSNTKKDKKVNFSIMNLLRKRSKYQNGIKIWYYSKRENIENNIGWHHTNEDVKYYRNYLFRNFKGKRQYYYTLSFDFTFKYDNDYIYFANCIPYTYTDLMKDLNYYTKYENSKFPFFHRKTLCQTLLGNDIDYITINNAKLENYHKDSLNKEGIVLFARQHPSETVGSWTIKGAIEFLMGESDEAKYLRDNFIFKIIPMINVDGVIQGNTRTSIAGCDLNRRWKNPNEFFHPEIYYSKEMIKEFSIKKKIRCIVDFHGHFGAFNSFFYGNHRKDNFSFGKLFPFTCAKKSKVISFEKSGFSMPKYKKGTGRINLFQEFNIDNVVTLETSLFGCNTKDYSNQYFNIETLKEIGRDICVGILYFHYHSNMKSGIENINNYPNLKKKIENDVRVIDIEFNRYIENKEKKLKEKEFENINNSNKSDDGSTTQEKNDDDDDDDDPNENESDSESNPSGDNLDIDEIKNLLPDFNKRKKRFKKKKGNNLKKHNLLQITSLNIEKKNPNNNNTNNNKENSSDNILKNNNNLTNQPLTLPKLTNNITNNQRILKIKTPIKENNILTITNNLQNNNHNKEIINVKNLSSNNTNVIVNINSNSINITNVNGNKVDSGTQTEEIFFKMHWSYFQGSYKILSSKIRINNIDNNKNMIPNILFQKYGISNKKVNQMQSYRNAFPINNDYTENNFVSILTLEKKDRRNNNINYNLSEKNKNVDFNMMKSMEFIKRKQQKLSLQNLNDNLLKDFS